MSKNLLRKVLAVGSSVVLGATLFAAPAQAVVTAANLGTVTYAGTGTKVVEGTDFVVAMTKSTQYDYYNSSTDSFDDQDLETYNVYTCTAVDTVATPDNCTTFSLTGTVDSTDGKELGASALYQMGTNFTARGSGDEIVGDYYVVDANGQDDWVATGDITWYSSNTKVTVNTSVSSRTSTGTAALNVAVTEDTVTTLTPYINVSGTAWADRVAVGPTVDITFANYVEADWVNAITVYPTNEPGYSTLVGTLTPAGTGWNTTQIDDDIFFQLYKTGLEWDSSSTGGGTASATDISFSYGQEMSAVYTSRAFITGSPNVGLGAMSANTTLQYLYSDAAVADITIDNQATANITTDEVIRSGVKEVTITATVRNFAGSPVAKAGQKVQFVVTPDVAMTFNGKAVAAGATAEVWANTNSSGVASLTVGNATAANGNTFAVEARIYTDNDGDIYYSDSRTGPGSYVWEDAYVYGFAEAKDVGNGFLNSVKGKSYTLNYSVTDNFGQPWSGADARVYLSIDGGTNIPVPVVNGKASYTVNEAFNAGEEYYVYADLYTRDSGNSTSYSPEFLTVTQYVVVVANNTPGAVDLKVYYDSSLDNNYLVGSAEVNYDDFGTNNFRLNNNTLFGGLHMDGTDPDVVYLTGVVTNTDGVILPGATVTLRGNGQFWADAYNFNFVNLHDNYGVYSENTITVQANGEGKYFAYFASHKSGNISVTATSGSASGSGVAVIATPDDDNADSLLVSAPKSVKAGRTVSATVSVVDVWGNVVKSADYDSAQLSAFSNRGLVSVSAPEEEALAVYQVKILLQSLDRGPVLVNLGWNGDTDAPEDTLAATGNFAVWAGPAVNAVAGAKKGRVVVEAYRAVGQTVNVFVGSTKVASFVPNKANDKFVVKGLKKGNRKVTVKVTPGYDFKGVIAVK